MYTIAQIEQVAINVFAAVTDTEDKASQLRMKTITELYCTMLANKSASIDEDILDEGTAQLISFFLKGEGAAAARFPALASALAGTL